MQYTATNFMTAFHVDLPSSYVPSDAAVLSFLAPVCSKFTMYILNV